HQGKSRLLWQSRLDSVDSGYSPRIQFIKDFAVQGVPVALVEQHNGAAVSTLEAFGIVDRGVVRLLNVQGSQFEIANIQDGKPPFVLVHNDPMYFDVPAIFRWTGIGFKEDSSAHPDYYRRLLAEDNKEFNRSLS